MDLTKYSQS